MGKYNKKVVVVIPIHSQNPSDFELISFQQCFKVLNKHDIKVLASKGLCLDKYKDIVENFEVIFIDEQWQSSIEKYNKLKLSQFFYKLFDDYQYLLTYELDAFVFKDDLLYWCDKGYDYIGAPWFVGYANPTNEFLGVGNSGFSLRNVRTFKRAISKVYLKESTCYYFGKMNRITIKLSHLLNRFLINFRENNTIQNAVHLNEDAFISQIIAVRVRGFKIATIKDAFQFSFELKPKTLYQMNDNKLPMGCHAWWKYNLEFWKPFIQKFGYKIDL
tara:strand:+ start:3689 stop:4510 length:822 start_codon:yes stop_codon:yes gene_type:complete